METSNRIVVDLNKVQYASFYYENQYNDKRYTKPKFSVHGQVRDPDEKCFGKNKTLRDLAKELKITDVWIPQLRLQLTANHSLLYTGTKAISIWKEWNRRIFKSTKQSMKTPRKKGK